MPAVHTQTQMEQAKVLYLAGMEPIEIGQRLGVHNNTVRTWAFRGHWKKLLMEALAVRQSQPSVPQVVAATEPVEPEPVKRDETQATLSNPAPLPSDLLVQRAADVLSARRERYQENMGKMADQAGEVVAGLTGLRLLASAREIDALDKVARRSLGIDEGQKQGGIMTIHLHGPTTAKPAKAITVDAETGETEG